MFTVFAHNRNLEDNGVDAPKFRHSCLWLCLSKDLHPCSAEKYFVRNFEGTSSEGRQRPQHHSELIYLQQCLMDDQLRGGA